MSYSLTDLVVKTDARKLAIINVAKITNTIITVQQGVHLQLDVIVIGDRNGIVDVSFPVILAGEGASADVRVLGLAQSSKIRIAASMQIAEGAQKTDGQLSMRGLLLNDDAAISMTPGLDVAANNVTAGHGASIDRVDPGQRFYLESRGLSSSDAQRMIWWGMLTDMVARYDSELAEDTEWLHDITSQIL